MARTRTLDDLLRPVLEAGEVTEFCERAGISPTTLRRMRNGEGTRNHRGTVLAIAAELGVSEAVVKKAIEASRKG